MEINIKDGEFLVKLARKAIEYYLKNREIYKPENVSEKLKQKAGVFVTLETYPERDLRGCIGYIEAVYPLYEATIKSAIAAATEDPRFPPVRIEEMDNIIVEVTILSPKELIKVKTPKDYLKEIEIGRHGLVLEYGIYKGVLLPQVPVEYNWSVEEFLSHLCLKAGLPPDCWFEKNVKIYRFEAKIFAEEKPRGNVVERFLKKCL